VREGDFDALLAVLDPDVVVRLDSGAASAGVSRVVRAAVAVAERRAPYARSAGFAQPALVNGAAGVFAASGQLYSVMGLTVRRGKIVEINILADPGRLRRPDLAVLND